METSVKDRIILFIKSKNISRSEFCRRIGVSETYIGSLRQSFPPDRLKSISINFPELNIEWLMTGDGSMLKSVSIDNEENENESVVIPREVFDQISRLTEAVVSQQRTIEALTTSGKKDTAGIALTANAR